MKEKYFRILKKSSKSSARAGILETPHGKIKTPFFMPIATVGAVKTLTFEDLEKLGAQIILSNTYHLMLRPGEKKIAQFGGLHKFMQWSGPILTDSGGFQVFSLSKLRKIDDHGVEFQSHLDGKKYLLTPEQAIKIQQKLGSDIIMVLDECIGHPCNFRSVEMAVKRTTNWAQRCKKYFDAQNQKSKIKNKKYKPKIKDTNTLLFGIIQGGTYKDLRIRSVKDLVNLNFDGYAVGGLAVGEKEKEMYQVLDLVCPELPENKPRYLMGVGYPEQIIEAVKRGIDMFDCVIPTREARHGRLYFFKNNLTTPHPSLKRRGLGKSNYQIVNIDNAKYKNDFSPINPGSKLKVLKSYSKAYLRHLFMSQEPLAMRLATLNNVEFYLELMSEIRQNIKNDKL